MRQLIYVPILHTPEDMGSLAERLREEYIARIGESEWRQHLEEIDNLWARIREKILAFPLDWKTVKVYQDGLPQCGRELEITAELANTGSKNYQLVLDLVAKGARLIGTEDPNLLVEEYSHLKGKRTQPKHSLDLLVQRDEYMANRIAETLNEGETGILFLGVLHRVDKRLPGDIKVTHL
ncbi:MAG: hypothetical protein ACE5JP_08905 [Candidatus Bipolaricaulia bacterium]